MERTGAGIYFHSVGDAGREAMKVFEGNKKGVTRR